MTRSPLATAQLVRQFTLVRNRDRAYSEGSIEQKTCRDRTEMTASEVPDAGDTRADRLRPPLPLPGHPGPRPSPVLDRHGAADGPECQPRYRPDLDRLRLRLDPGPRIRPRLDLAGVPLLPLDRPL